MSYLQCPVVEKIPLWESRWDSEALKRRKSEIGELAFNRGFRQIPSSDEDALFKSLDNAIHYGYRISEHILPEYPRFTSVDLSGDNRPGTVIFTFAVIPASGVKVVLDVHRGSWTMPETLQMINSVYSIWQPQFVAVETNGYQKALVEMIRTSNYRSIPVVSHHTGMNKTNMEIGIQSLEVELENGLWIFPFDTKHSIDCNCGMCAFVNELRAYPFGNTDDCVMAWWIGKECQRLHGGALKKKGIRTGRPTAARRTLRELS